MPTCEEAKNPQAMIFAKSSSAISPAVVARRASELAAKPPFGVGAPIQGIASYSGCRTRGTSPHFGSKIRLLKGFGMTVFPQNKFLNLRQRHR
jgi:hypothetical protein